MGVAAKERSAGRQKTPRIMTPLEKTSRSPMLAIWWGMYPSRARIDARRGKPVKALFAARTNITIVAAWTRIVERTGPEDDARQLRDHGLILLSA